MRRILLVLCFAAALLAEIPETVLAEQNLEKRSELALKEADDRLSEAVQAYSETGALKEFEGKLEAAAELTSFGLKSLQDSGKRARKSPKYFKRAELRLRNLLRRIDTLEREVSVDDRPPVEKLKQVVAETHEQILHDIMSKR